MRIIIEEPQDGEQDHIIIRCRSMGPDYLRVIAALKTQEALTAYDGSSIHKVRMEEVYYIETVDNKTFVYCQDKVYELKQRLYELEETLDPSFQRVSKSVILSLPKIRSLSPALNGRFEALLDNGEKVIISRQYVGELKRKFGV